jgi:hypothetical protein
MKQIALVALASLALFTACKSGSRSASTKGTIASSAAVASGSVNHPSGWPRRSAAAAPSGPVFAIEPGKGFGPVRFGATVQTIERLMQSKCEQLTDTLCRYFAAGIEYQLTDGVVSGMAVFREGRSVTGIPGKTWGLTRLVLPPDIVPRVVLSYVHSVMGKPESWQQIKAGAPDRTVLRETYPGLIFEYDRSEFSAELVLGCIRVLNQKAADKPH